MLETLSEARRAKLKTSFVTRRVPLDIIRGVDTAKAGLKPGDVLIAEVVEIGQHTKIERPDGRRAALYPGDEVLLAAGARYAPDQFEAFAPTSTGPAHLVAAGGIAGVVAHAHERIKPATSLRILGAAATATGATANLADFAAPPTIDYGDLPVIAVAGTSMNAGKTFSVASIVRGLCASGLTVAALKATGTGAGGDLWRQLDAGAALALDFTDAGFATTYQVDPHAIEQGAYRLLAAAREAGADVAVMEIADGLRQDETAALLASEPLRWRIDGVVFAAGDAMGAERGVEELQALGHRVLAVSGQLTRSPLMIREAGRSIAPPVLTAEALSNPDTALGFFKNPFMRRAERRLVQRLATRYAAPAPLATMEAANVA